MSEAAGPLMEGEDAAPGHQRVGWFELFYDLVIVASVGYATHSFIEHPSWGVSFWMAAWTLIVFVMWSLTTLNNNLFPGDHPSRRILGLFQMLALVIASLGTVADEGLSNSQGFLGLGVAFATICAMYVLAVRRGARDVGVARLLAWSTGIGALVLLTGVFLPDDTEWGLTDPPIWILTVGVGVAAVPLFTVVVARVAERVDEEHLAERLGQLVLIVLGESFVSLISNLSGLSNIPNPLYFVITFFVIFAIWTIYFSSVLPAGLPQVAHGLRLWLLVHWILMFGAIGTAAGFAAMTLVPFGEPLPDPAADWSTIPLAVVMASITLLTWLGRGSFTRLVKLHALVTVLLLALALLSLTLTVGEANWEMILGSLLMIGDALLVAGWVRPYGLVRQVS